MSSLDRNRFWRSFADLEDSPELPELIDKLAEQYPEQADQLRDPLSRRRFFQLMGASMALAGVTGAGCRWEEDYIVPLSRRPEDYIPGKPKFFATSMELGGAAVGLLAKSFDGRPIKIEGNPEHPNGGGKTSVFHQASILHLYDPDRSQAPSRREKGGSKTASWSDFDAAWGKLVEQARGSGGAGLAVLAEASSSPTLQRLRDLMEGKLPRARWFTWEPLSLDSEHQGTKMAFGAPHRVHYRFEQARTIVALDCDFLGDHPDLLRYARDFASGRTPDKGEMSRLYAVESAFSITGACADHRLPLRSELIRPFLLALEGALLTGGSAIDSVDAAFLKEKKVHDFIVAMARDLAKTRRNRSLIAVGRRQPPEVHAIAARINQQLGAAGSTVVYTPDPEPERQTYNAQLRALTDALGGGQIDTLLVLGGNPVYDSPADLDVAAAIAKAGTSVHLSMYEDETSVACTWHVPRTHFLEEWGDGLAWDGSYTLRQPLVRPLFGGRTPLSMVKDLAGEGSRSDRDLVRDTFKAATGGGEASWREAVQKGFVANTAWPAASPQVQSFQTKPLSAGEKGGTRRPSGELEVVFTTSSTTYDGRYANNAWLQETPDFLTKLTWDNAALIAPRTAADLGIKQGDVIKISLGGRSLEIPAYVMPGQAASSIALELGFGRERAGLVAGYQGRVDSVGFNAYKLRAGDRLGFAVGAAVATTGKKHLLVSTQDHWQMDKLGREAVDVRIDRLVRSASLEKYQREPGFVTEDAETKESASLIQPRSAYEKGPELYLYKTVHDYSEGHKWGMSIDLTKCIGCNACMVACQSENNVPVVGKEQVYKNREMHWIRIDRYFAGDPDDPEVAYQPVHCQQCENAPCEEVCPVGATSHSHDGLNDQAYNRCVGTRYCENNCPYKVRRFNFHYWHKPLDDARNKIRGLIFNPNVTVRSRGVMEKCTWCVQRIRSTVIEARNQQKDVKEGDILTACQQACPTDAIVFGDLNDPDSQVSQLQQKPRAYLLLPDLNNRPRNAFLARIRNTNPELAKAGADESSKEAN